jgi:hypothetical protein
MDIIPAGDRGQRLISREELTANDAVTLAAFEVLVREEAQRRGLLLESAEDFSTGGLWIRWRPGA